MDTGAFLPIGALGALAVQIRGDLGLSVAAVSAAVSVFFLAGSVTASILGPEIDRLGWHRTARAAAGLSSVSLLLIALSHVWGLLALALVVGGAGLALTFPSTNVMLHGVIAPRHLAMAISIKTSATPVALLAGGAAVPAVALTIGWRWVFLVGAALPLAAYLSLPRPSTASSSARVTSRASGRAAQRRVWRLGLSTLLASLLPGALTGSCVISLVGAGMSQSTAGLVFALANVAGIAVRLVAGWLADRSGTDGYRAVATFMILGGTAAVLLATEELGAMVVGAVVAFGLGWGWTGLVYFMAVRIESENPGSASAVMQTGGMLGSGLGPAIVGVTTHLFGLPAAWVVVAVATVLGGVVVARARRFGGTAPRVAAPPVTG
jgi:predicted MFS family arabinose efflux permease